MNDNNYNENDNSSVAVLEANSVEAAAGFELSDEDMENVAGGYVDPKMIVTVDVRPKPKKSNSMNKR